MRKICLKLFVTTCLLGNFLVGRTNNTKPTTFSSLNSIKRYAAAHPEYPGIDNLDWGQPNYTTFLKSLVPSYYEHFMRWLDSEDPLWTAQAFKSLLEQTTKERELNGYIGRFILKIDPSPDSEFVIFGNLNGAFHSFVRDLSYLELRGYIDKNLFIKPDCYFIFNGNLIDKSPYSLELLTLVMQIMHKNPHKVFYIRGSHEDKEEWRNYSLKNELMILAQHVANSHEKIPLSSLINRFFNTLPLALYLVSERTASTINVIRISHYGLENREIQEKKIAGFLDIPGNRPKIYKLNRDFTSKKNVNIKALITGEKLDIYYKKTPGLRSLGKEKGINTWAVLSSPIGPHRRLYKFFYDAFTILKTYADTQAWKIVLYNQDVRSKIGFKKSRVDDISTGLEITGKEEEVATAAKKDRSELEKELKAAREKIAELKKDIKEPEEKIKIEKFRLGTTLDLTSKSHEIGNAYKKGMLLAIDEINKSGGINGIKLTLDVLDDGFVPDKARENVKKLIKRNIDTLILPLGFDTLNAYIDLVKNKKLLVLFPATGAMEFRNPELDYLINYRLSNRETATAVTKYMLNKGNKKFAFLYRNDILGKNSLTGAINTLKSKGITDWISLPVEPTTQELNKQINTLKSEEFDALGFFTLGPIVKRFITASEKSLLFDKKLFGIDPLTEQRFQDFIKKEDLTVTVPFQVPNPKTNQVNIVKEYAAAANNKDLNPFTLEGYICIQLLAEIINRLEPPITKNKLVQAFESLKNYDFHGITLNFDAESRTLKHPLWIYSGKEEWEKFSADLAKKETQEAVESQHVIEGNIKIGSTMDLSKSERDMGRSAKQVLKAFTDKTNQKGGINGREIDLSILDDGYNPERALNNVKRLISQGSGLLLNPLGSPTLTNYLNLVKNKNTMVFFPLGNSPLFFDPSLKFLLNFGPPYTDEGYYMIHFAKEHVNFQKIALFYQETIPGIIDGARKALKELGSDWVEIAYNPVSVDYSKQIKKLRKENPDSIVFFSTATFVINLIRQIGVQFFIGKIILGGISWSLSKNFFKNFLNSQGLSYIIPSYVPNPSTSTLPIVKEYRKFAKQNSIKINPYSLQAYLSAKLLEKFISEATKNGKLTWEKIMQQAEQLKNFDLGGITFSFNPQKRNVLNSIWIDSGDPEWKKVSLDKNKFDLQKAARQKPLDQVIKDEIKIGSTMDLSRIMRNMGRSIESVLKAYTSDLNAQGGIKGKKIDLAIMDDGYQPLRALSNVKTLLQNGIGILLNPLGTPTLATYLNLIKDKRLMTFFPIAGASNFYEKKLQYLINFGSSYAHEGYTIMNYIFDKYGKNKKIALFYLDQIAAGGGINGARKALNEKGISNWVSLGYESGTVNFKKQIQKLKKENPDIIVCFGSNTAIRSLVRQAGVDYFFSKKIIGGITFQATSVLKDFLRLNNLSYSFPSTVPNPKKSNLPIVQEFRKFAKKHSIKLEPVSLLAYISFTLLKKFISDVDGKLTWKKIMQQAEQLSNFDLGGMKFTFDPKTRTISNFIWIDSGQDEWEKIKINGMIEGSLIKSADTNQVKTDTAQ